MAFASFAAPRIYVWQVGAVRGDRASLLRITHRQGMAVPLPKTRRERTPRASCSGAHSGAALARDYRPGSAVGHRGGLDGCPAPLRLAGEMPWVGGVGERTGVVLRIDALGGCFGRATRSGMLHWHSALAHRIGFTPSSIRPHPSSHGRHSMQTSRRIQTRPTVTHGCVGGTTTSRGRRLLQSREATSASRPRWCLLPSRTARCAPDTMMLSRWHMRHPSLSTASACIVDGARSARVRGRRHALYSCAAPVGGQSSPLMGGVSLECSSSRCAWAWRRWSMLEWLGPTQE